MLEERDIDRIVELVLARWNPPHVPALQSHQAIKGKIFGSAADEHWGYRFGIDGLMSVDDAAEHLAVSGRTLDRLTVQQKIRKGRYPSGVRAFCKRSVTDFAQSLEE
jgi:hypothetical protein